jgi:hypothetical protein
MIRSAEEFVRLRMSHDRLEYSRAATDNVESPQIWHDVIARYPQMSAWVAHNKNVPVDVLRNLSRSEDPAVRAAVAQKRKCPEDVMMTLAADTSETVRLTVALNPKATVSVLLRLENDPWHRIREAVRKRIGSGSQSTGTSTSVVS